MLFAYLRYPLTPQEYLYAKGVVQASERLKYEILNQASVFASDFAKASTEKEGDAGQAG